MFKFLDLKYEAFGLDINDSSLKIIKLKKNKEEFSLSSFAELKIGPALIDNGVIKNEGLLVKAIKTVCASVKGKKLKTKYVVCSLPEEESFLQVIQMPKMEEDELKSAIIFEAENHIPLPTEQVYLDSQRIPPLEKVEDHHDALVVAMSKKTVDAYLACIKKAGLVPIALEIESQSISRALIKNEISEQQVVILDIGENNTDFVVFSGRSVRFSYSIPVSSSQLTEAIAKFLEVKSDKAEKLKIKYGLSGKKGIASGVAKAISPLLEKLVLDIKKHIEFYREHASHEHLFSKYDVQKIIICGGGANLKGLSRFLSRRLGITVVAGDPFINAKLSDPKKLVGKIDKLSFAACFGLAQRAVDNSEYEY